MFRKSVSILLMLTLLLSCVSFASADTVEVTLPTYKTGENVGAIFFEPLVERFNAAYEGKYHIDFYEIGKDTPWAWAEVIFTKNPKSKYKYNTSKEPVVGWY